MNHIELFAGCGGLSLGLETAGFSLFTANEISPMASESFAFNHLNVDLENNKNIDKIFWVSSSYPRSKLTNRLRENPNDAIGLKENQFSDLLEIRPTKKQLQKGQPPGLKSGRLRFQLSFAPSESHTRCARQLTLDWAGDGQEVI